MWVKITTNFTVLIIFFLLLIPNTQCLISQSEVIEESSIDKEIELLMRLGNIPSLSASIIHKDKIVWADGFGYSNIKEEKEASSNTIYMVGSITKPIIATAIMQLVDKGLINLNDDISKYLPFDLKNPNHPDRSITIEMLLSHNSSLNGDFPIPVLLFYYFSVLNYPYEYYTEFLLPDGFLYYPSLWSENRPGEKNIYTSVGYEILGYLINIVTNSSFSNYCKDNIFKPLGMNNTSFFLSELNHENLAKPCFRIPGIFLELPHYDISNDAVGACGGLRTNVLDLSKFLIAHMNDGVYRGTRLLSSNSINLSHNESLIDVNDDEFYYGLGWFFFNSSNGLLWSHEGKVLGFSSIMRMRLSDEIGILLFFNENSQIKNKDFRFFYTNLENLYRQKIEDLLFYHSDSISKKFI